jgi:hypothetical protein
MPIPVNARSKAWLCGRLLAGMAGSMSVCLSVVCCHIDVSSATG